MLYFGKDITDCFKLVSSHPSAIILSWIIGAIWSIFQNNGRFYAHLQPLHVLYIIAHGYIDSKTMPMNQITLKILLPT